MGISFDNFKGKNIYIGGEFAQQSLQFKTQQTTALNGDSMADILRDGVFDETTLAQGIRCLQENRILVLHGSSLAGKLTYAIKLCHMLELDNLSPCRLVPSLPLNVKVTPTEIGDDDPSMRDSAFIFRNALGQRSQDLTDFLKIATYQLKHEYVPRLQSWNGFLIFTGETSQFAPVLSDLDAAALTVEVQPPSPDMLEHFLRIQLKEFKQRQPTLARQAMTLLEMPNQELLFQGLQSFSRLRRFLELHLEELSESKVNLKQALTQFDDVRHWFFEKLPADFGVWTHAASLAILCFQAEEGVPWMDFNSFYRWFTPIVRRHFPSWRQHTTLKFFAGDHALFQRFSAEVRHDPRLMLDRIGFSRGPDFSQALWRQLLKNGRRLLTPLIPELKRKLELEMTLEEEDEHYHGSLEGQLPLPLAAKVLGRLGEIQPHTIAQPLFKKWVNSRDFLYWEMLGHFMTGVYLGGNRTYRDLCWSFLDFLEPDSGTWRSHANKDATPATKNDSATEEPPPDGVPKEGKPSASGEEKPFAANQGKDDSKQPPATGSAPGAPGSVDSGTQTDDTSNRKREEEKALSEARITCRYSALCACYFFLIEQDRERMFQRIVGLVQGWLFRRKRDWDHFLEDLYDQDRHLPNISMVHPRQEDGFDFPEVFDHLMYEYGLRMGVLPLLDGLKPYLGKTPVRHKRDARIYQPLDWLVLFLLLHGGLFERWTTLMPDPRPNRRQSELQPFRPFNLIVASISGNEKAVRRLAAFLNLIFENIGTMRAGGLQQPLKIALQNHLVNWAVFSLGDPEHREAMESLFTTLLMGACQPFKTLIRKTLTRQYLFSDKRIKLHQMAARILKKSPQPAGVS